MACDHSPQYSHVSADRSADQVLKTAGPEFMERCGKLSGLGSRAKDTSAYGEEAAECGTESELLLISELQSCLEATSPSWRRYVHVD